MHAHQGNGPLTDNQSQQATSGIQHTDELHALRVELAKVKEERDALVYGRESYHQKCEAEASARAYADSSKVQSLSSECDRLIGNVETLTRDIESLRAELARSSNAARDASIRVARRAEMAVRDILDDIWKGAEGEQQPTNVAQIARGRRRDDGAIPAAVYDNLDPITQQRVDAAIFKAAGGSK